VRGPAAQAYDPVSAGAEVRKVRKNPVACALLHLAHLGAVLAAILAVDRTAPATERP
jgi:hypothetical protein